MRIKHLLLALTACLILTSATTFAKERSFKATASVHDITFTWTAPVSPIQNLGVNIYCTAPNGTSGGELSTPVNPAPLPLTTTTYVWTGVVAGAKYSCVGNTVVGTAKGSNSTEVNVTVPLVQADLPVLGGFGGSAE